MSSQIFKEQIPNNIFFELLDKICLKNEKHYTFNINSFKKGFYNDNGKCMPCYKRCKSCYGPGK